MTIIPFPGTVPLRINRAALHAVADVLLPDESRLTPPITDLDMARLIYALEAGTPVVQGGPGIWTVPISSPLRRGELPRLVIEALRVGLVRAVSTPTGPDVVRVSLEPAPVHLRRPRRLLEPLCDAQALRYRRTLNRLLVDCDACLQAY